MTCSASLDRDRRHLDSLTLEVEPSPAVHADDTQRQRFAGEVRAQLYQSLGLNVHVDLLKPLSLPRGTGKTTYIIDRR